MKYLFLPFEWWVVLYFLGGFEITLFLLSMVVCLWNRSETSSAGLRRRGSSLRVRNFLAILRMFSSSLSESLNVRGCGRMDCAVTDGGTLEFDSDGAVSRELMKKVIICH